MPVGLVGWCRYGEALLSSLPPGPSLLLSHTDLNWNPVRYLQASPSDPPPSLLLPPLPTGLPPSPDLLSSPSLPACLPCARLARACVLTCCT